MLISVIIPIYNTKESYLRECLSSVHSQEYKNFEIIMINDGCTDSSHSIMREYTGLDQRFILIETENRGAGAARNIGIEKASGDYIMFLDSDDYLLDKTVVSDIAIHLDESSADILSYEYVELFNEEKKPAFVKGSCPRDKILAKNPKKALEELLRRPRTCFSSAVWTKVVKSSIIKNNDIKFPVGIYQEDLYFTVQLIEFAKKYDRYDMVALAVRRTNPNSRTVNPEKKYNIQHDVVSLYQKVLSDEVNRSNTVLLNFLASPYAYWMGMVAGAMMQKDDSLYYLVKKDIENMKKYAYVLKYSPRTEVRLINFFYGFFGIHVTIKILQLYLSLNRKHVLSINRKI